MIILNNSKGYGLVSKMFHWATFIVLIVQVPFGFYLVGLEFSDQRIDLENVHILIGISIFYLVLIRLIWKVFNPKPKHWREFFKGQTLIAGINHYLFQFLTALDLIEEAIFSDVFTTRIYMIIGHKILKIRHELITNDF